MRAAKSKGCGAWIKSFVLFACVYALGGQARADLNVYSTGFEDYVVGPLDGQHGWVASSTSASVRVQSSQVSAGSKAVEVVLTVWDSTASTGVWREAAKHALPEQTAPLVTVIQDVKLSSDQELEYGIALLNSGDDMTNLVHFSNFGSPSLTKTIMVNEQDTGHAWSVGTWEAVKMELDYNTGTLDVYYGGTQVADNIAFMTSGMPAWIVLLTDDAIWSAGSSMFYDDLAITAIPVPGSLLLGAIGLVALRLRTRHRQEQFNSNACGPGLE